MGYHSAGYVRAPLENATDEESTILFTAGTDHAANAVPVDWEGAYVKLTAIGGNLWFLFSSSSSAEVDRSEAASAAGNSGAKVGDYLAAGGADHVVIPRAPVGGRMYFVREADATTSVSMRRAS